ncbi:MAG TPA: hypothetical protein PKE40_00645 [Arachnia sp.]|nr:hypothetical protein [Arachnia sp.]HMT84834.1 hypothetical protein [Arachnia sp.]
MSISLLDPADGAAGIRRRQVLAAGAWAAPVLAATAAISFAAATTNSVIGPGVVHKYAPSVGSNAAGRVNLWSAQVWYDAGALAAAGGLQYNDAPPTGYATWTVYVLNAGNARVGTLVSSRVDALSRSGNATASSAQIDGLPAGQYTVVSEITAVSYDPNPYQGVTFSTPVSQVSSTVTVG